MKIHTTPGLKLGKRSARPGAVKFSLSTYLDRTILPKPPETFGHDGDIVDFGMLGNDVAGNCVWAGGAHETMLWNREAGRTVDFSIRSVLSDYSRVTGYNPGDPTTDQGTDVKDAASYRRKVGLLDAHGHRHKVAAYLAIDAGDVRQHLIALYLFGAVGIGIEFPDTAMDQFDQGKPWDVVSGAKSEGGHYVPLVAKRGNLVCVTWGREQEITPRFLASYNDESVVYLSDEALAGGRSLEGFDKARLLADLAALAVQ